MTAIVGLTGGIASGKSTVGRIFRELGVHVVDADLVAREVVAKGSEGLAEVVRVFGEDVLAEDGSLDRKKVGAIVFADAEKRKALEAITHPRIAARSMSELAALAQRGDVYGIYEAALLVENGSYRMMQALVVVAASAEVQVARVTARDALDQDAARARLAAQLPLEQKIAVADHVIWNDGDLAALRARTDEVHHALLARFGGMGR
ncbi:dephospho-CoA kinase [Sandaracinus amylolyticus]|uniref:Dephospho-CoA kinase n=1 Tax=Sandaracinus amylolyticus TaxID=927083 RepID=A0A0F6SHD6_9BACT|nr:dephospho-CoA kinase [Sandaracinus amylolyticus]AKF10259.1 Dephospho-CoA kinase [Sandaracinus amylolyticus]